MIFNFHRGKKKVNFAIWRCSWAAGPRCPCLNGVLDRVMSRGPFQPHAFSDSVILVSVFQQETRCTLCWKCLGAAPAVWLTLGQETRRPLCAQRWPSAVRILWSAKQTVGTNELVRACPCTPAAGGRGACLLPYQLPSLLKAGVSFLFLQIICSISTTVFLCWLMSWSLIVFALLCSVSYASLFYPFTALSAVQLFPS